MINIERIFDLKIYYKDTKRFNFNKINTRYNLSQSIYQL